MVIAIKSEMDARVVLYPLMQACNVYGSVLVLSSNKYVRRIIDDQEFSTFKNIVIVVDEMGTADDMCQAYNIALEEFDFILMENVSAVDYDKCICIFGQNPSELFAEDIEFMKQSEDNSNLFFINYGKQRAEKKNMSAPKKKSRFAKSQADTEEIPEDYDPEQKFRDQAVEEKKRVVKEYQASLPSFEMIEKLEGMGQFEAVDEKLCEVFFAIIGEQLNIQYNLFRKEIRNTHESGSSIKSKRPGR